MVQKIAEFTQWYDNIGGVIPLYPLLNPSTGVAIGCVTPLNI